MDRLHLEEQRLQALSDCDLGSDESYQYADERRIGLLKAVAAVAGHLWQASDSEDGRSSFGDPSRWDHISSATDQYLLRRTRGIVTSDGQNVIERLLKMRMNHRWSEHPRPK